MGYTPNNFQWEEIFQVRYADVDVIKKKFHAKKTSNYKRKFNFDYQFSFPKGSQFYDDAVEILYNPTIDIGWWYNEEYLSADQLGKKYPYCGPQQLSKLPKIYQGFR